MRRSHISNHIPRHGGGFHRDGNLASQVQTGVTTKTTGRLGRLEGREKERAAFSDSMRLKQSIRDGLLAPADHAVKNMDNFVWLNVAAGLDIWWAAVFTAKWHGTTRFEKATPHCMITSDTSDSWGCGAYKGSKWIQFQWPPTMEASHISVMEMIPAVMAAALWGQCWKGKSV